MKTKSSRNEATLSLRKYIPELLVIAIFGGFPFWVFQQHVEPWLALMMAGLNACCFLGASGMGKRSEVDHE